MLSILTTYRFQHSNSINETKCLLVVMRLAHIIQHTTSFTLYYNQHFWNDIGREKAEVLPVISYILPICLKFIIPASESFSQ
jgi:hypothetical protein